MELILDFKTWRAGGGSNHRMHANMIGTGRTELRNTAGFMCCLGQFALQSGFDENEITTHDDPEALSNNCGKEFEKFSTQSPYCIGNFRNTDLASDCMHINDNDETTYQEKISLLTERLAKENITLTVINLPS